MGGNWPRSRPARKNAKNVDYVRRTITSPSRIGSPVCRLSSVTDHGSRVTGHGSREVRRIVTLCHPRRDGYVTDNAAVTFRHSYCADKNSYSNATEAVTHRYRHSLISVKLA